jgi:hypothetical protein
MLPKYKVEFTTKIKKHTPANSYSTYRFGFAG